MMRSFFAVTALASSMLQTAPQTPAPPPAVPHHEANFETERQQANELYLAGKSLEALPLYEDLCRQDPTVAVFAERHGAGLLTKSATISDPKEKQKVYGDGLNEIKRAQALGDNSPYVRAILSEMNKSIVGAVISGFPLSVGYTHHGTPEAQAVFSKAEAAFGHSDWANASKLYVQASELDPAWYDPALYAGDSYFRAKDVESSVLWYKKAVAIDPNRETAYRYWGDALFRDGDPIGAREKYVEAVVSEPYGNTTMIALGQWAQHAGHQLVLPAITRPNFTTKNGVLEPDPALEASTEDGRSSWILYQQYRVAHGGYTLNQPILAGSFDANGVADPKGYRHTIAEEHAALRAMLADIKVKLKDGTLQEENLDPSIRNIRNLEKGDALGAWIAINAADAGIRSDYPDYRSNHRKHLVDYINTYLIR